MRRFRTSLLWVLSLTAIYLFAWPTPTLFFGGVDLLHVLCGVVLAVVILLTAMQIFRGISPIAGTGWALLILGTGLGIALIFTGTRRQEWPLLYTHIVACVAGISLLAADWSGKRGWLGGESGVASILRAALFLLVAAALAGASWWVRTVPWQNAARIQNPAIAPASMDQEGDGSNGPFFPSSAQTAHGGQIPANFFMESEACQRCHADIYREWQSSAHHFSSFNNQWYRKSI